MAQVMLHKIDPVTAEVKRIYVDLEKDATYNPVSTNLPLSLSGRTQVQYVAPSKITKAARVLETALEVDALHQLAKAIAPQGQAAIVEATLELNSGNVLDLAAAANGTTIASTKIIFGIRSNIATATGGVADAVRLPAAANNLIKVIQNPNAFAISVFPNAAGEYIAGGAGGAAYSLAAGASISFYTKKDGATTKRWFVIS